MLTRSKIQGMVIGGAIGDAAGKPVETWTPEKILEVHPDGITKYLSPMGHKWFADDEPPGSVTDDTQLTEAILLGFIEGHEEATKTGQFNEYHHAIAEQHVLAFNATTDGWGNTTRDAVRNICNGLAWDKAGESLKKGGTGNGVPMKIAPFAAWYASPAAREFEDLHFNQQVVRHSAMTHFTDISAHAALVHTHGVYHCLFSDVSHYSNDALFEVISDRVWEWGEPKAKTSGMFYQVDHLRQHPTEENDSLEDRMIWLFQNRDKLAKMKQAEIRERFDNGGCYVLQSLPFAYAYFLKNPFTPQAIIDVIEAGGDTDTNAKIVGELLGALNGIEIFQEKQWRWMCKGLLGYDSLIELADRFCDTFGIEDE
jgi:ADP-ribosylglycohydrolase